MRAQASPFGYEERLTGASVGPLDDPWGGVGRDQSVPGPVTLGTGLPKAPGTALHLGAARPQEARASTRWNVGVQRQVGDTMAVSATYLGNRMVNIWGDVNGNPGASCRRNGRPAVHAAHDRRARRHSRIAPRRRSISAGRSRRRIPSIGQYIGYLDWVTDAGWQRYHGVLLSVQKRAANGAERDTPTTRGRPARAPRRATAVATRSTSAPATRGRSR